MDKEKVVEKTIQKESKAGDTKVNIKEGENTNRKTLYESSELETVLYFLCGILTRNK